MGAVEHRVERKADEQDRQPDAERGEADPAQRGPLASALTLPEVAVALDRSPDAPLRFRAELVLGQGQHRANRPARPTLQLAYKPLDPRPEVARLCEPAAQRWPLNEITCWIPLGRLV